MSLPQPPVVSDIPFVVATPTADASPPVAAGCDPSVTPAQDAPAMTEDIGLDTVGALSSRTLSGAVCPLSPCYGDSSDVAGYARAGSVASSDFETSAISSKPGLSREDAPAANTINLFQLRNNITQVDGAQFAAGGSIVQGEATSLEESQGWGSNLLLQMMADHGDPIGPYGLV